VTGSSGEIVTAAGAPRRATPTANITATAVVEPWLRATIAAAAAWTAQQSELGQLQRQRDGKQRRD
jgi:hypothetical protein